MRNEPQVNIRLPAPLKLVIEDQARKNGRSITSEIVTRLQASIEQDMNLSENSEEPIVRRVELLENSLKRLETTVEILCHAFLGKGKS